MQTLYALTYATRKSEPAIIHDPHDLRTEIRITTGYREHAVVRVASSVELDTGCVRYRAGNHERKYAPLPARPFTGSYMCTACDVVLHPTGAWMQTDHA